MFVHEHGTNICSWSVFDHERNPCFFPYLNPSSPSRDRSRDPCWDPCWDPGSQQGRRDVSRHVDTVDTSTTLLSTLPILHRSTGFQNSELYESYIRPRGLRPPGLYSYVRFVAPPADYCWTTRTGVQYGITAGLSSVFYKFYSTTPVTLGT